MGRTLISSGCLSTSAPKLPGVGNMLFSAVGYIILENMYLYFKKKKQGAPLCAAPSPTTTLHVAVFILIPTLPVRLSEGLLICQLVASGVLGAGENNNVIITMTL